MKQLFFTCIYLFILDDYELAECKLEEILSANDEAIASSASSMKSLVQKEISVGATDDSSRTSSDDDRHKHKKKKSQLTDLSRVSVDSPVSNNLFFKDTARAISPASPSLSSRVTTPGIDTGSTSNRSGTYKTLTNKFF